MYQVSYKKLILISLLSAVFAAGIVMVIDSIQYSHGQTRQRPQNSVTDFHLKEVEGEELNNEAVYNTVSPGVFFYRLRSDVFRDRKKMILLP